MEKPRKIGILVVDDEESTRWGLARLLTGEGFEADEAVDGRMALEKLSLRNYDLIVTDMKMPRMGGMEFIKAIRHDYRGRIIVMTAYGTAETYFKALDFGAFEYIHKPVEYDNLLQIIRDILRRRESG